VRAVMHAALALQGGSRAARILLRFPHITRTRGMPLFMRIVRKTTPLGGSARFEWPARSDPHAIGDQSSLTRARRAHPKIILSAAQLPDDRDLGARNACAHGSAWVETERLCKRAGLERTHERLH
jgi:hypothetical protein